MCVEQMQKLLVRIRFARSACLRGIADSDWLRLPMCASFLAIASADRANRPSDFSLRSVLYT